MLTSFNVRYAYGFGSVQGAHVPDLDAVTGELTFDAVSSDSRFHEIAASFGSGLRF